jgi:hypothetical protein
LYGKIGKEMLSYSRLGLNGRLGNQMFQYASLRGIAASNQYGFVIPPSGHQLFDIFEMPEGILNCSSSFSYETFNEPHFHFDKNFMSGFPDNRDLFGYFQAEKYFKNIEDIIKNEFSIKSTIIKNVDKFTDIFKNYKVFSIHFRRTDYLNNPNAHPTPSQDYYQSAINLFDDYDFGIVFSDDINWCKSQNLLNSDKFIFSYNHHFVDLYLMTQCHSNIIANSSFSWWGAWLNQNKNKSVIAPSIWFGPPIDANTKDLIPEDWTIL